MISSIGVVMQKREKLNFGGKTKCVWPVTFCEKIYWHETCNCVSFIKIGSLLHEILSRRMVLNLKNHPVLQLRKRGINKILLHCVFIPLNNKLSSDLHLSWIIWGRIEILYTITWDYWDTELMNNAMKVENCVTFSSWQERYVVVVFLPYKVTFEEEKTLYMFIFPLKNYK